ncbi:hypothetical protein BGX38DRAFT_1206372 [Terfezia claveryi]|nr:hypothetical protein BGX38DRAFT_1206372 [Terfezia claveryi]
MASVPYIPTSDPTDGERAQLYRYHLANKFLNQQELAQWFERSFDRSINQSSVSCILRKFNEDPDLLLAAETTHKSTKRNFFEKKQGNYILCYIQTIKFLN